MTGVQRPHIFKFIENLKKDEDISRAKINSCNTGLPSSPKVKKYRDRDFAIKNSIEEYLRVKAKETDDQDEDEEEEDEVEEDQHKKWLESPEMVLLNAMASNSRLDKN